MKALLKNITVVLVISAFCSCEVEKVQLIDRVIKTKEGDRIRWIGCLVGGYPEGIWEREDLREHKLGRLHFQRGELKSFSIQNMYGNELVSGEFSNGKLNGQFSYKHTPQRGLMNIEGQFREGKMIGMWTYRWIDGSDWMTIDFGTLNSPARKIHVKGKHDLDSLNNFKENLYHKELGREYSRLYNESLKLRIQAEKISHELKLHTASKETLENYFEIHTSLVPDSPKGLSL